MPLLDTALQSAASPVTPAAPAAVSVAGLSKTFRGPPRSHSTLRERLTHPRAVRARQPLRALRDVDLEVRRGEFLAVVGRNGSGKSTLLRCIADIYPPDRGRVSVRGRLATFIEMGVGFNSQLTGRENALTNAVLMGLPRRTARRRLPEILAFAELESFAELELKQYSSGMRLRLAFAVAAHVDADVLLVDEVLAVGDAAFQQKCLERFAELRDAGATMVLVTHDMGQVERLCDRALVLEQGQVDLVGAPERVARRYHELCFTQEAAGTEARDGMRAPGTAWITDAWFEDGGGRRLQVSAQGEPCALCMEVHIREPLEDPVFGVRVRNGADQIALAATSLLDHGPTGQFDPGERAIVRIAFENWLAPGHYSATAWVNRGGTDHAPLDVRPGAASLLVQGGRATGAVMDPPRRFELERA
jgi:ABC-type polysaccharide/polyol phosphate transport system ATPase subunit